MKIFISYASAGAGHFKAAQALYNCFRLYYPQVEVKLIDVLNYAKRPIKESYTRGYTIMISYMPWLWKVAFYLTSFAPLKPIIDWIRITVDRLSAIDFTNFIISEKPDVVISTHFMPSELVAYLKTKGSIQSKLITVITDFGAHPFWLEDNTDIYIAACDITKRQLVSQGVEEGKINVLGIPVDEKFNTQAAKRSSLFKKFNLDENKFTVLVATGSFGIGPIADIVEELYSDVQMLVVCARNKKLFNKLAKKDYKQVGVFGFVDNMEELMSVSDVIITKPGGLSISEILAIGTVPVFISAIPGQETQNIKILSEYGIGVWAKNIADIKGAVLAYKGSREKMHIVKQGISNLKKPFAARELCDAVCTGSFWSGR